MYAFPIQSPDRPSNESPYQPPNDFIHFGREGVRDRCLAVCSRALAILDTIEKMGIKGSRGTIIYFVRLAETLDAQARFCYNAVNLLYIFPQPQPTIERTGLMQH